MLDYVAGAAIALGLWAAVMAWAHYDVKVRLLARRRARGRYYNHKGEEIT